MEQREHPVDHVAGLDVDLAALAGCEALDFPWVSLLLPLIYYDHQILPDVLPYPTIFFALAMSAAGLGAYVLRRRCK